MDKTESYKILCNILYNGIKEKLDAMRSVGFALMYLDGKVIDIEENELVIFDSDPCKVSDVISLAINTNNEIVIKNAGDNEYGICFIASIVLLFLTEFFSQGHTYEIDWEDGINEFGSYSPALKFNEEIFTYDGSINYYSKMVDFLSNGIISSTKTTNIPKE